MRRNNTRTGCVNWHSGHFAGRATYGKANPHNLYLNWLLEAGFLGSSLTLAIASMFRASWHARFQPGGQMWWLLALGLVTCQLASGITNGLWPAGWLLILAAGALARKETCPRTPPSILVIRRDNIGDLVCTTPFVGCAEAAFSGSRIAVVVNSYNAQVL